MPTEEKLAKPHSAYKVINLDLSDKASGSMFARAPYATNSLRAVFNPRSSAEAKVSDRGTPINHTIGKKIYQSIRSKETRAIKAIRIAPTFKQISKPSRVPLVIASIELS